MAEEQETIEVEVVEEADEEIQSAELVIREERETMPAPASVLPSPKEWEATLAVAAQIAATPFVPESYRGKPESVVAAILTGREMGIGPMQSMRQIHMIDGRPAFAADLMLAKMRQGGLTIIESSVSEERAYIKAKRKDTGEEAEVEWTIADAEAAGLLGKKNWKTYKSDMLWARCVGRLARRLGSDLLGGLVYSKEEMEDFGEDDSGGGYGVGDGYAATPTKPFDPEKDLMPGAITGPETPKLIGAALDRFDPGLDWKALLAGVVQERWGVPSRNELDPEQTHDFWRRLSNAVAWIDERDPPGDFPPVETELIAGGFAFAFSGVVITEMPRKEAPPTDEDDVPWPDVPPDKPATYEREDE